MPKISAMTAAVLGDVTTTDLLPLVDSAGPTSYKVTLDLLRQSFWTGTGYTAVTMGIGGAGVASRALNVVYTALTGVSQYSIYSGSTFASSATTAGYGVYVDVTTAAAAYTMANLYAIYVKNTTKGAGSTITNHYGIYVEAPTQGGTLNYGIYVAGGTPGIYVAAGGLRVEGNVGIGIAPATSIGIRLNGAILSGATSQFGTYSDASFGSGATTSGYQIYTYVKTTAAAFTMTTGAAVYIAVASIGAGSAITNHYGIRIEGIIGGGTINADIGMIVGDIGLLTNGTSTGSAVSKYDIKGTTIFDSTTTTAGYGAYFGPKTAAAAFTMVDFYGVYIDAVAKGAGSTITNRYGLYVVGPTDGGTINYGVYISTGTPALYVAAGGVQIVAGNVGIGVAQVAATGLRVSGAILTASGNTSTGVRSDATMDSAATTAGRAVYAQLVTAAAAFTMTSGYGILVDDASKGAGSTITSAYGIYVIAQTKGGTNNYALYLEAPSGGSSTNTTLQVIVGSIGVALGGVSAGAAVTKTGVNVAVTWDATTTTAGRSLYVGSTTAAAAFTMVNRYGIYVDYVAKGAGSTITNDYGIYVVAVAAGATVNESIHCQVGTYGVRVGDTSAGSATTKYCIGVTAAADSATTAAFYGLYSGPTTDAAAFTVTNLYGAYVDAVAKGVGSTITNRYGVYIVGPSDGGTINYALVTTRASVIFGLSAAADVIVYNANAALATNATVGFLMISSCAGVATGVPATIPTGAMPVVFDSTNNKIGVYDGGWLWTAALT